MEHIFPLLLQRKGEKMKKICDAMKKSILFAGIKEEELEQVISCFDIRLSYYDRDQFVVHQGERAKGVGLVISGRLHIVREDFLGNREILTEVGPGDIFDEVYAVLADEYQSIAVAAVQQAEVAFFSMEKMLTTCSSNCTFHNIIIKNMLRAMAQKNLMLTRKMAHLSRKSIREKLVSYLSDESSRQGKREIVIPFNRQQLADYLSVERSALSRELSKMRDEGMIEFYKNRFILYN